MKNWKYVRVRVKSAGIKYVSKFLDSKYQLQSTKIFLFVSLKYIDMHYILKHSYSSKRQYTPHPTSFTNYFTVNFTLQRATSCRYKSIFHVEILRKGSLFQDEIKTNETRLWSYTINTGWKIERTEIKSLNSKALQHVRYIDCNLCIHR